MDINDPNLKEKATSYALHYWYVFALAITLSISVLLWNSRENQRRELEALMNRISVSQSLAETNAQLDDMIKREKDLYPALKKTLEDLKKANAELENAKSKIKLVERKEIDSEISKMDSDALSNAFTKLGYPSSVVRK